MRHTVLIMLVTATQTLLARAEGKMRCPEHTNHPAVVEALSRMCKSDDRVCRRKHAQSIADDIPQMSAGDQERIAFIELALESEAIVALMSIQHEIRQQNPPWKFDEEHHLVTWRNIVYIAISYNQHTKCPTRTVWFAMYMNAYCNAGPKLHALHIESVNAASAYLAEQYPGVLVRCEDP